MDDSLVRLWENLDLSNDEHTDVLVENDWLQSTIDTGRQRLLAKFFGQRMVHVEVMQNALQKIWRLRFGLVVRDMGRKLFLSSLRVAKRGIVFSISNRGILTYLYFYLKSLMATLFRILLTWSSVLGGSKFMVCLLV
ncbi:hypothetical protein PTKIN_Ptkin18bG0053100 [Pterospermum kingtungense]